MAGAEGALEVTATEGGPTFVVLRIGWGQDGEVSTAQVSKLFAASALAEADGWLGPGRAADWVNDQIARLTADFVLFIDDTVTLNQTVTNAFAEASRSHPNADVFFADSQLDRPGRRLRRRPDHSPERLRCQYFWGPAVAYRRDRLVALGGLDAGLPGAELHDLALRASRSGAEIWHIRDPAYTETGIAPAISGVAAESVRIALQRHLDVTGGGTVHNVGFDGVHDTRRAVQGNPLISIVIPTRGTNSAEDGEVKAHVVDAIRSIVAISTYRNIELLVVVDHVAEPDVLDELREIAGDSLHLLPWTKPFNFSEKVNWGALHANGEYVLLLNDDIGVITPNWLESLLALAQLPGAGMVGGMLYYADDTIQHAGHAYHDSNASHIGLDRPRGYPGPLDGLRVERETMGVTAACALMPIEVFHEVGGLTNLLPGNFNDVDLCMKVTWLGHEIYWTPHAELYHYESKTRDASVHSFEVNVAWGRWGFRMHDEHYWPYPLDRPPATGRKQLSG